MIMGVVLFAQLSPYPEKLGYVVIEDNNFPV
jgi:hypothetical protein